MRLTPRDADIVSDVAAYTAMTRDQIQRKRAIGSVPRANAVLLRLVRANYLARRYQPTLVGTRRPVYFLGPRGTELLDGARTAASKFRTRVTEVSDLFLQHQLALNEARMTFEQTRLDYVFEQWTSDLALREKRLGLIPDGYVEFAVGGQKFTAFIEVDLGTESLARWRRKVEDYLQLAHSGLYQSLFHKTFFRTLVLAPSEGRVKHIQKEIATRTPQIFWLATASGLSAHGPLGAIWRRPRDDQFHLLTEPS